MKQVSEESILDAIANVNAAIGAMDTISEFVDPRSAAVLRKYRGWLANTSDEMQMWLEEER